MDNLKPCPFCGGKGMIIEKMKTYYHQDKRIHGYTTDFYIRCERCNAEAEHYDNKDLAIKAWNRRVAKE